MVRQKGQGPSTPEVHRVLNWSPQFFLRFFLKPTVFFKLMFVFPYVASRLFSL
jgi:hypothetical protein